MNAQADNDYSLITSGFVPPGNLLPFSASDVPSGRSKPGIVYGIVDRLNPKMTKIGHTRDLKVRLRSLNAQTAASGFLICAFYFRCDSAHSQEQHIFEMLASCRIKPKKEWFWISPQLAHQVLCAYFNRRADFSDEKLISQARR